MVIPIEPIKLVGNWAEGFALNIHTTSSEFMGEDEFGHTLFDTKRSELGELVYQLKYKSNKKALYDISDTVVDFLNNKWHITRTLNMIVPVPPSNVFRAFQPVIAIASNISRILGIRYCIDCLFKVMDTPELKDINDTDERIRILKNAFGIKGTITKNKSVLLFDDLYRSGETLRAATSVLCDKGMAKHVFVLALTKTRSRR